MSKTNSLEAGYLDLFFLNVAFANVGDASGLQPSAAAGSFFASLHTADPGEAGDQTTNECAYTSYARVAIPRTGAGFSRTDNVVENADVVTFPQATGGSETATHFGLGSDLSGPGNLWYKGALTSSLAISNLITPEFAAGAMTYTEE